MGNNIQGNLQYEKQSPDSSSKPDRSDLRQNHEILEEFFDWLVTLIFIFRSRRLVPTFTNIKFSIEYLTDRRFTHGHLAQLKFLLSEALVIKNVSERDESTGSWSPDLHISLNPDAVGYDAAKSVPQIGLKELLNKLFQSRLREFWESHQEGDEIPEETLPGPFNRPKKEIIVNNAESANMDENAHLATPSLLPRSFTARFSKRFKQNGADDMQEQPLVFSVPESSLKENPPLQDTKSHEKISPTELASEAATSMESSGAPLATPSETNECTGNKDESLTSIDAMSTPKKHVSTPLRLMSATPALRPPKRHRMSPDDNSTSSLNKLARRPPRARSLKFDAPVKTKEVVNEDNADGLPIDDDDVFDILPESLIQSIKEKVRMAMEEKDPAISQAKKRKKDIASLPKLFDMIRLLFRQRSCITKAELVSKIIIGELDILDTSEVEERLNLLQELAPEWIYEKQVSSGDFLFFINKMLSPETIRASLVEAAK